VVDCFATTDMVLHRDFALRPASGPIPRIATDLNVGIFVGLHRRVGFIKLQ
jgi:hypothetical protein